MSNPLLGDGPPWESQFNALKCNIPVAEPHIEILQIVYIKYVWECHLCHDIQEHKKSQQQQQQNCYPILVYTLYQKEEQCC